MTPPSPGATQLDCLQAAPPCQRGHPYRINLHKSRKTQRLVGAFCGFEVYAVSIVIIDSSTAKHKTVKCGFFATIHPILQGYPIVAICSPMNNPTDKDRGDSHLASHPPPYPSCPSRRSSSRPWLRSGRAPGVVTYDDTSPRSERVCGRMQTRAERVCGVCGVCGRRSATTAGYAL